MMAVGMGTLTLCCRFQSRWSKWRERRSRVEKDVRRTDRSQPFYRAERGRNVRMLRAILLSYAIYNYDLGYVQASSGATR